MGKKILTIEIGARFTKICELTGYTESPVIHSCIRFVTPKGSIEDGYIRDVATLSAIVNQKLVEMKTKVQDAVFIVNSTKIANREIMLPNLKKEEKVRAVIDMQAVDHFPFDISDYTVAYYYMDKAGKKEKSNVKNKVLLLAAPNSLLQSYINLADTCHLKIAAIDYVGNSYFQVVKKQVESGVNIGIHIGESTSIINVFENEKLLLQRIIPYGADEVIEKVKQSDVYKAVSDEEAVNLLCDEKLINYQFELPKEEVNVKYSLASESYDHAKQEMKAKEEITNGFRFILNNVIRVLDYYTTRNTDKKIAGIYLSGFGSKFQGITHLFKNEIGFDVRRMEEVYCAKFSSKSQIKQNDQADYINCIGAGIHPVAFRLQQMQSKKGAGKTELKHFQYAFVFFLSVTLCFIGLQFVLKITAISEQQKLESRKKELSSINKVFDKHDVAKSKYDNMMAVYTLTDNDNKNLHTLLDDLEKKLPSNMSVSSLAVDEEGISMHIKCSNKISIAKMIMSLSDIKSICNITVPSIGETVEGQGAGIVTDEFDVICNYSGNTVEELTDSEEETDISAEE